MTTEIIQGDSGNIFQLVIQDGTQIIDLTNATVQVVLTFKGTGKIKQAEIVDPVNGLCQITLTSEDTLFEGIHSFQATVTFSDGRKFTSNIQRFNISKKIGFVPSTGGGSVDIITGNNGHILVNGLDVKVYDDATVKQDISTLKDNETVTNSSINNINTSLSSMSTDVSDLKNNKHNHSNLSVLNQLSTDGTNLLFNGASITVDTSAMTTEINSIKNSDAIKRLGVSSNGKLTIDGVEVTVDDPTSPIDGGTFTTTYNTNIVDGGEF
jgi:hypothetical protein